MKKTLTATYVIKQHHRIVCRMAVQQSDETGLRAFIGIRHFADVELPVGTRLLLDIAPREGASATGIDRYRVMVQSITPEIVAQINPDKPLALHHLSPIHRERIAERRSVPRKKVDEYACELLSHMEGLEDLSLGLTELSMTGFSLIYRSVKPVLGLQPAQTRTLRLTYKEQAYEYTGQLVHWITDWHKGEHRLGFKLDMIEESDPRETVLRFLLDPSHTVDITHTEKIDASTGKIRAEAR